MRVLNGDTTLAVMVSDLGIIDWLALIVAAVLLAGACAAAVIATMAMQHRRRTEHSPYSTAPVRVKTKPVVRSTPPRLPIIDLRRKDAPIDIDETAEARASRAEQLRNRTIPDVPPALLHAPASAVALRDESKSNGFTLRGPGFFEDPIGRHEFRYWDGSRWTEHVKEHGQRFIDPL